MSKQGFTNEDLILGYLNHKKFKSINKNWQKFLKEIFPMVKANDTVFCLKRGGANKSDLVIIINGISKNISIKIGTGNSIHQEPIEEFIIFLKRGYNIHEDFANDLRFFIWGDGTLDGKGNVNQRLSAPEFTEKYPEIIKRIRIFFKEHKLNLIKRFVIAGPKSRIIPEYLYYGNKNKGVWKKTDEVINWLCKDSNESNGAIPVGRLTFQAWNRNINGGDKSEKKRGVIQLKWGTVGEDLKNIFSD